MKDDCTTNSHNLTCTISLRLGECTFSHTVFEFEPKSIAYIYSIHLSVIWVARVFHFFLNHSWGFMFVNLQCPCRSSTSLFVPFFLHLLSLFPTKYKTLLWVYFPADPRRVLYKRTHSSNRWVSSFDYDNTCPSPKLSRQTYGLSRLRRQRRSPESCYLICCHPAYQHWTTRRNKKRWWVELGYPAVSRCSEFKVRLG